MDRYAEVDFPKKNKYISRETKNDKIEEKLEIQKEKILLLLICHDARDASHAK